MSEISEEPQPSTTTMPAVEEAFEEIAVDEPLVGIIMGSKSDKPKMQPAGAALEDAGIRYEVRVMSAHRDPELVREYCTNARMRGLRVIIAGAGMSAALPGVAAAHTDLPVIGVPILGKSLGGLDALLSAVQMPPGIPVAHAWRSTGRRTPAFWRRESSTADDLPIHAPGDRRSLDHRGERWSAGSRSSWPPPRPGPKRARCRARQPRRSAPAPPSRSRRCRIASALTDHDVAAFVDVVAQSVGEHGRWVHYGLTSSDVLDTALALQLRQAGEIVLASASAYREALIERALEHRDTLCVGRTHGVHAEPTSFGLRLAGFAFEADRNLARLAEAFDQLAFGKLSGAVGTYASAPPAVEARVMERLGLRREDVATQVIPRDRHAVLTSRIAIAGGGLERFATEVRNLQRTEVREVEEPFGAGQKGSSAMPHKRNPIRTERITGLSRVLRGYAQTGLENIALWHERDISHSSAERVIIPDATIALDYMQDLAAKVAAGMTVRAERMRENLELTHGALFSQRALSALVESGMARDDAYRVVQESAQRAWDTGAEFRDLLADAAPDLDLDAVFDYGAYLTHLPEVFERLEALRD